MRDDTDDILETFKGNNTKVIIPMYSFLKSHPCHPAVTNHNFTFHSLENGHFNSIEVHTLAFNGLLKSSTTT